MKARASEELVVSTQGEVCFYTKNPRLERDPPIGQLMGTFRCTRTWLVLRTDGVERGWAERCRNLGRPTGPDWTPAKSPRVFESVDDTPLFDWEILGDGLPAAEIPKMYIEGRCLHAELDWPDGLAFENAVRHDIPEAVHGGFIPGGLGFRAGGHDLCEEMTSAHGELIARATFTVFLRGHGSPNDWPEFLKRYLALDQVRTVRAQIESVIGPTEVCMLFS
jgi:hypothetical protein